MAAGDCGFEISCSFSTQASTKSGNNVNVATENNKETSKLMYKTRKFNEMMTKHFTLKCIQVILAVYVGIITYINIGLLGLRDKHTGYIIDPESQERTDRGIILLNGVDRPITATTDLQLALLALARMSAFFMYPALVMVFVSKFRVTISVLARSPISMFLTGDMHKLHAYCGQTILLSSLVHTICHVARWVGQRNLYLLTQHFTGITGLLAMLLLVAICVPMVACKKRIRYEIRKNMHYLFIIFALMICFHTKPSALPGSGYTVPVFGTLLVWHFLDAVYCTFWLTEKIETTKFEVLPTGVQMTMKVSPDFQKNSPLGGYCYVCLPWVTKRQWHAFSLFANPSNPQERQIFMQRTGDWTNEVHDILQRDTVRPAWIQGPFPSPYDNAEEYDNQILVASGIGITPALSVISAHKDTGRKTNLIWMVRDIHLLEFFLLHLCLDESGWNLICYTGKEDILEESVETFANVNISILRGRPNLSNVIPNIIYGREMEAKKRRISNHRDIMEHSYKPWDENPRSKKYVKSLDNKLVLKTYGLLYCGGAAPVQKSLRKISDEYGLDLHIESFSW